MKKNQTTSQSAMFNPRLLLGVAICLTGISLALVGFGQTRWDNAPARSGGLQSAETQSPDVTPTPTPTPGMTFTVTNTAVSGLGSLRQAILDANGNAGIDTIAFNIPASDPNCSPTTNVCTITPTAAFPLPPITDRVTIDGYTQRPCASNVAPCSHPNMLAVGDDAVLLIVLDGSAHTDSNIALLLQGAAAGGSVI